MTDADAEVEKALDRFWAWYTAGDPDLGRRLLDEAIYDAGHPKIGIEVFVWGVEHSPRLDELEVLDRGTFNDGGAFLFEGLDPVTGLRHRIGLFVKIERGAVRRIREVFMTLPGGDTGDATPK